MKNCPRSLLFMKPKSIKLHRFFQKLIFDGCAFLYQDSQNYRELIYSLSYFKSELKIKNNDFVNFLKIIDTKKNFLYNLMLNSLQQANKPFQLEIQTLKRPRLHFIKKFSSIKLFHLILITKYTQIKSQFKKINMKRLQLKKQQNTNEIRMSVENLKICVKNQQGYETFYLNDSLQLQYYSFCNIQNLQQFVPPTLGIKAKQTQKNAQQLTEQQIQLNQLQENIKGVNTLYLNNNLLTKIQNLSPLKNSLITLNLSHNQILKFQGLNMLQKLSVLDFSYNRIQKIQIAEIKGLNNLKRLNLIANKLTNTESIEAVKQIGQSLQTLELANNQNFLPEEQSFFQDVLQHLTGLKVLVLKETLFARTTKAYRKQVILNVQSLTFLDQRPVSQDQRFLARAWRRGGLVEQRQARKMINEKKQQKNHKILHQIEQRNRIVDQKVQKIYSIKASKQINQLQSLISFTKSQDFQLVGSQQQMLTKLQIQQLQKYLQLIKQECRNLDLDRQLGLKSQQLPRMLIQNRTSECIYIYNVTQKQLELIKQKYYKDQTLPLKSVNYQKKKQLQWIEEYDGMLETVFRICKGNWSVITPSFNLDVYQFDSQRGRKIKRWSRQQLQTIYRNIKQNKNHEDQQGNQIYIKSDLISSGANELDCLD